MNRKKKAEESLPTEQELKSIRSLKREIDELRIHLASIKNGGSCAYFASDRYKSLLCERIDTLKSIYERLLSAVERIEDSRLRRVVMMRYVYGWSWQKIAFQIDASSESTPRLLLRRALDAVCCPARDNKKL